MKLTALSCQTAKPKNKPYKLTDGRGLFLLIKPDGGKYWRYNYRFLAKQHTLAIGVYPEISLSEAREKHRLAHKQVADGQNPNQVKKQSKHQIVVDSANTFESIAKEWLENKSEEWTKEYCDTIQHRLERDLFPKLGNLPIKTINAPIILDALKAIEKRGVFETTKRSRQYCSQILRYAIATGRSDRDYTVDLKGALKTAKVQHHSALDVKELPDFLKKLDRNEARLFPQTIIAIKLLLLTFVRTNELIEAVWDEFDLKNNVWIIPAKRMKMRKAHIIPLSKQVLKLLNYLKETNGQWQYVLPGQNSPRKPMSNNTILYALYRLGYKGKTTGHGFRALAMTAIKEQLDYRHEVVDRQLAHAHRNSVDAAYDRAQFLKERTKMMQDWADYIDTITHEW